MFSLKRNICLILLSVFFLLGNGVFYSFMMYKKTELARLTKRNLQLRKRIAKMKKEIEREKQFLSQERIAQINFFQLHEVPFHEQTSFFLKKIAELSSTKGVKVLQIKPLPHQECPYYTKFSFALETEASYTQLLNFIKDVEYTLGLNIEELNVIKDKTTRVPKVKMVLNSIEMKGQNFSKIKINLDSPPLPQLKRDPFAIPILKAKAKTQIATSKNKSVFRLQGIMRYKNIYKAMINNKVIKQGDIISGYKVSFIKEDRVILVKNEKYIVLRPGTATVVKKMLPREIEAFLNFWKSAWEKKNLEAYMSCYSPRFSHQEMDWHAWRRYKKGLFNRYQKIKLTLENIQVSRKGEKATVSFKQYFQTERYKDKGLKTLDLEKENGEWKIVQETWEKLSD